MKLTIRIILFSLCAFLLFSSFVAARETVRAYTPPDIKDSFCGTYINFAYCKCTFHNTMCDVVGMSSYDARTYTVAAYNAWWKEKAEGFGRACIRADGIWNRPSLSCITCDVGYQKDKGRCVVNHASNDVAERYGLPTDFEPNKVRVVKNRAKVSYADGEVFIWMNSFGKWVGPVHAGHPLYTGDILLTTERGEALVTLYSPTGEDTIVVNPETKFDLPDTSPIPDEPIYVDVYQGVVEIYNAISDGIEEKLDDGAKLTPSRFNVRMGVTVVGVRGTDVILSYENERADIILDEGIVDVFTLDNPTSKLTLSPGEKITYDEGLGEVKTFDSFERLQETYNLKTQKFLTPTEDLIPLIGEPIDPDAVYPLDVLYDGEFAEDIEMKNHSLWWLWIFIVVFFIGIYLKRDKVLPFLYT